MYKDVFVKYKLIPRKEYKNCNLSENEKIILCKEGLPDIPDMPWLTFNTSSFIFLSDDIQKKFEHKFIIIAYSYELPICIGKNSEIVSIDLWFEQPVQYVNRNLESFLECIAIYLTYHKDLEVVFDLDDSHEKERVGIVMEMRKIFSTIDARVLDNASNF